MKTEDIIKSLEACSIHRDCDKGCMFANISDPDCLVKIMRYATSRLKELSSELKDERYRHDRYVDFELDEAAELANVKAERDAAIRDLKECATCTLCKFYDPETCVCVSGKLCVTGELWEWRGVMTNE